MATNWPNFKTELEEVDDYFPASSNLGLLLGDRSNGLIDIDLDCDEAVALAPDWLPHTRWIHGRDSSPMSHYWYVCSDSLAPKQFLDVDGSCLLEIRSSGQQTLIPPSIHPSGEELAWSTFETPSKIDGSLKESATWLAACTLVSRHWPAKGSRQEFALTLSGALIRSNQPKEQVEKFIRLAAMAAEDEEYSQRVKVVEATLQRFDQKKSVRGLPTLTKILGESVVAKLSNWLHLQCRTKQTEPKLESSRKKASTRLLELTDDLLLFCSEEGKPFASRFIEDRRENYPIAGSAFKRLLQKIFYEREGTVISANSLTEVLGVLEAKSQFSNKRMNTFIRVGGEDNTIYLDLGREDWSAIRIDSSGWEQTNDVPIPFWRSSGLRELQIPKRHGQIDLLGEFLNVADSSTFHLILAWLVAALRPTGPYPILVLTGQAGSAKSTTAQVLRKLVDPAAPVLRSLPRDERDLMIAASTNWVLPFDNLSGLSNSNSDILCRMSTGGGYAKRALFTNDEEMLFSAQRPIILTSIDDVATREDLLDRAIVVSLQPIPAQERRDERTFWNNFQNAQPYVLGVLLDAVSTALKNESSVVLERPPRLADFARWSTAAESSLGIPEFALVEALRKNRVEAAEAGIDADPIAGAVIDYMTNRKNWKGTASDLLGEMNESIEDRITRQRLWPKTPASLANRLRRVTNLLSQKHISISFHRSGRQGTRLIELSNKGVVE